MMSKALEEELHNPMNIHRWRKLEGNDPEIPDLLNKTMILQKRLLEQGYALIEYERRLKEAEHGYVNLRMLVAKQPGAKEQEKLNKTQKKLFSNTVHNKCLISELNMLERNNVKSNQNCQKCQEEHEEINEQLKLERILHAQEVQMLKAYERALAMSAQDSFTTSVLPPMPGNRNGDGDGLPSVKVSSISPILPVVRGTTSHGSPRGSLKKMHATSNTDEWHIMSARTLAFIHKLPVAIRDAYTRAVQNQLQRLPGLFDGMFIHVPLLPIHYLVRGKVFSRQDIEAVIAFGCGKVITRAPSEATTAGKNAYHCRHIDALKMCSHYIVDNPCVPPYLHYNMPELRRISAA